MLSADSSLQAKFTYLLGPIKIALRPRIITTAQLEYLMTYGRAMWSDSLKLEKMWLAGELDDYIDIEEEELAIARLQPWQGGPAIFAASRPSWPSFSIWWSRIWRFSERRTTSNSR